MCRCTQLHKVHKLYQNEAVPLMEFRMRLYLWWSSEWGCTSDGVQNEAVPLMEFMSLVFTCMPGGNYRTRLRSLLVCLCDIFWVLINSLVFVACLKSVDYAWSGNRTAQQNSVSCQRHKNAWTTCTRSWAAAWNSSQLYPPQCHPYHHHKHHHHHRCCHQRRHPMWRFKPSPHVMAAAWLSPQQLASLTSRFGSGLGVCLVTPRWRCRGGHAAAGVALKWCWCHMVTSTLTSRGTWIWTRTRHWAGPTQVDGFGFTLLTCLLLCKCLAYGLVGLVLP